MPRMPETVRMLAPSNLDTSSWLLNMPPRKAVCLCTLKGVPFSFSFFMILTEASRFSTTPVALIRQDCNHCRSCDRQTDRPIEAELGAARIRGRGKGKIDTVSGCLWRECILGYLGIRVLITCIIPKKPVC